MIELVHVLLEGDVGLHFMFVAVGGAARRAAGGGDVAMAIPAASGARGPRRQGSRPGAAAEQEGAETRGENEIRNERTYTSGTEYTVSPCMGGRGGDPLVGRSEI